MSTTKYNRIKDEIDTAGGIGFAACGFILLAAILTAPKAAVACAVFSGMAVLTWMAMRGYHRLINGGKC